ncbi:MAG: hypothetical protein Q4B72_05095 [Lachnospiraceae bacterium]|nr:hypothetical protein [Lachnospiraceae bacterium]
MNREEIIFHGVESYSSYERMEELKAWLFKENVRVEALKQELLEREEQIKKKETELNLINQRLLLDQKRLKEDELFFDKKMAILKDGFRQLDMDRRKFEAEKITIESSRNHDSTFEGGLFGGVNSLLALKKRYKDLMKIYHPDNLCGDSSMVRIIHAEYEKLRDEFDYTNII